MKKLKWRNFSQILINIGKSNFLNNGKTVAEIKDELVRLKLVPKDIQSVAVAGVMRNLRNDEFLVTGDKQGRKDVYFKE